MKTIIVCDAIHPVGFELLKKEQDINVIDAVNTPKDELLKILGEADVAITRSSTEVNEAFLNAGKKLKAIVRAGVGVDNVDIEGCSRRGIIAMNVPTANTIAAVELTMAHMLASARSLEYAHNDLKLDRIWKREKWYGVELFKKKLGVIGFGNIGSRVAVRAKAFGMEIIAYDPYIDPSKVIDMGGTYTKNFDDILAIPVNMAGLPAISIPISKENLPYGMQIIGDSFSESKIYQLAYAIEKMIGEENV